ncbi:hypothetical protein [Synechocystis sp. LKSZ1]|uniref:hypothetical protein n=1 Tax=Synechocystis sp. LKSZ1 TaxID=3144951 RepID=UPI00336C294E
MSTIIETDLKDILAKFDQRFDRLEQRLDRIDADLTDLKVSQTKLDGNLIRIEEKMDTLDQRVQRLEDNQNKQIWALILAILGALITATIRFGFFPKA